MTEKSECSVFVALGSNQGDRKGFMQKAMDFISQLPQTRICEKSDSVESTPEGTEIEQPMYLNSVIRVETGFPPVDFLEKLKIIERKLGRMSKGDGAQRTIDIDILSIDNGVVFQGKSLTVPHPRMHLRRFVLEPLVQIAPDWTHPKLKKSARMLLEELLVPENKDENCMLS